MKPASCRRTLALCALFLQTGIAFAQQASVTDPLFESMETLDAVFEGPLSTLMRYKPKADYLDGVLRIAEGDDSEQVFDIEFRARGNSRHEWCDFPPVLLHFKKSQVKETLFATQNKVKLVVHCKSSVKYEQIVLKEYLTYRMLNAITDRSFRVRLLRIRYVDTDGRRDDVVRHAFLIEHKKRLAARLDTERLSIERTHVSAIQPDHLNISSMFAYMVGNTDFSPVAGPKGDECCHNYVLFSDGSSPILAVPYDFDQSGVVDAPYAVPNRQFGIRTVKQRVYRGRCANNEYLESTLQRFREHREDIFELIARQEGFADATRRRVGDYIADFYELIDDPRRVQRDIIDRCL